MIATELLETWLHRAERVQNAHYSASDYFEFLSRLIGIPAVILSTLVGTTVFATLSESTDAWVKILVGLASVTAAILTAVQTTTNYGDRAQKHHWAGVRYGCFKREIQEKMVFSEGNTSEELQAYFNDLRLRWDQVTESCPTIPMRIWNKSKQRAKNPIKKPQPATS